MANAQNERIKVLVRRLSNLEWHALPSLLVVITIGALIIAGSASGLLPLYDLQQAIVITGVERLDAGLFVLLGTAVIMAVTAAAAGCVRKLFFARRAERIATEIRRTGIEPELLKELYRWGMRPVIERYDLAEP